MSEYKKLEKRAAALAEKLDACWCDDGRGLPECEKCQKNRAEWERLLEKLRGLATP